MRATLAIAGLSIRSAIRSRLVICLVIVLATVVIGLPLSFKGDGTMEGEARIIISYCLGLSTAILAVATLWISCMLISREVQERQIHQVVTKPVHRFQIWLGKWMGLAALNAVLLGVAGLLTYGSLMWRLNSTRVSAAEKAAVMNRILVGRRQLLPEEESVDAEVHREIDKLIKQGLVSEDQPFEVVFQAAKKRALSRRSAVAPDAAKTWVFRVPRDALRSNSAGMANAVDIRFHLSTFVRDRNRITGTWKVGTLEEPEMYTHRIERHLDGTHRFSVPVALKAFGKGPILVTYQNGGRKVSHPAVFLLNRNIELLVRESSFEMNLLRAMIVMLTQLALLAALGLAVGTVFSFPVATFSTVSVLLIVLMVHYFAYTLRPDVACNIHGHTHGTPREETYLDRASERLMEYLSVVVEPVMKYKTLGPLSDGILISWRFTGQAILFLVIVYPGLLGLAGGLALARRELALPER